MGEEYDGSHFKTNLRTRDITHDIGAKKMNQTANVTNPSENCDEIFVVLEIPCLDKYTLLRTYEIWKLRESTGAK
ncbi:hypothetical protein KIN20_006586 [Parelaphostrongylus tenuis]|uniref:Uncharacterized protein n=1 Tax=Parelaphostrongylus tenuis TaxID=148309 RepID=A0AAD5M3T3_PARTN|nr:hypothetical protein KIN20_006586 [Parelaphostrongylus tenuis]